MMNSILSTVFFTNTFVEQMGRIKSTSTPCFSSKIPNLMNMLIFRGCLQAQWHTTSHPQLQCWWSGYTSAQITCFILSIHFNSFSCACMLYQVCQFKTQQGEWVEKVTVLLNPVFSGCWHGHFYIISLTEKRVSGSKRTALCFVLFTDGRRFFNITLLFRRNHAALLNFPTQCASITLPVISLVCLYM